MRNRETRALVEAALARFVEAIGDDRATELTVIGGLNADLLTSVDDIPHQGTNDVDLLLQLGFVYERDEQDFAWLERGLVAAGFATRPDGGGWRWWREVNGVPVKLELLCDVYDNVGQEIALPGCARASAQNLRGPAAALRDRVPHRLPATESRRDPEVAIAFTGLGGYVLSKAAAVAGRQLDKDFYDLAFVLIYNTAGGPAAAGRAARAAIPPDSTTDYPSVLLSVMREMSDPSSRGARSYANGRLQDGVDASLDVLTQDAAAAALECLKACGLASGTSVSEK